MWTEEMFDANLMYAGLYVFVFGIVIEAAYQKLKLLLYPEKRKEEVWDWKDEICPVILGVVVVLIFYPTTLFDFLPFVPTHWGTDIVFTSLIISRGANGAHESYKGLADFFTGLIGRIAKRW